MDLNVLAGSVDRLITVDIAGRGVVQALYDKAREVSGGALALKAAQALQSVVGVGDNVLIATGFLIPPTMAPETDGPLGALALSRALDLAFGARSAIVAEKEVLHLVAGLAKSINLAVSTSEGPPQKGAVGLLSFPLEDGSARRRSARIIEELNPSAIVSIEKVGRNRRGVYHNMRGNDVSERSIKVDCLFQEAAVRKILTIGVGDGGNEIGMGKIAETVRMRVPYGEVCNCPCRAGIACETSTDHLVVASVSNWGVYGVLACLSATMGKPELLHGGRVEKLLLSEAGRRGAVDGVTGEAKPSADGLSSGVHANIVELLRELASHSI